MTCFCKANLDLLPSFSVDTSLNLSVSAQTAFALYTQISLGIPDLPSPQLTLSGTGSLQFDASAGATAQASVAAASQIDVSAALLASCGMSVSALASIVAMAQLSAQASSSLDIDLSTSAGITALAQLAATLDARIAAITALDVNLAAWIQLAAVNTVAVDLTAMLNACISGGSTPTFSMAAIPPAWGGSAVTALSALATLSTQLDVDLDAAFVASLQVTASAIASATANVSLNASIAANLSAGICAIAQLNASLGVNALQVGFPAVQAMVGANFSAMSSIATQLGINLSAGSAGLPALPTIPGFSAALTANLTVQLQAAISAAASLSASASASGSASANVSTSASANATASAGIEVSMSALQATSLSVCLSAILGINITSPTPCSGCDLLSVMDDLNDLDAPALPLDDPLPAPDTPTETPPALPGAPQSPASSPPSAAGSSLSSVPTAAASSPTSTGAGSGPGGSGGSGGGGGVPATVMTAQLMCTMGMAPSALVVLPINRVTAGKQIAANIMDHVPMENIVPFGMCMSLANPTVATATAAKFGVLTPMPCIPATASPWMPGASTVMLGKQPMLDSTSTCMCTWAGMISIVSPGQEQTVIP